MKDSWERAINFVLVHEGGYTADKDDPGGATNFGISQRSYPDCAIAGLTIDGAKEIYKRDYWNVLKCDDLPYPLDMVIFDTAVNVGRVRAQNWLQGGEYTLNDYREVLLLRILHYTDLARKAQFQKFLRGWLNRCMDLYREV
jgi:lysozyme family protein